jgi:RNA polymerase sigma factor (sigma-70 family)
MFIAVGMAPGDPGAPSCPTIIRAVLSSGRADMPVLPARGGRIPQPPVLVQLLRAATDEQRDAAWAAFVAEFSRLILYAARQAGTAADDTMDAYAHALERLRADDLARLRAYRDDGRTRFTTWLVVVVRRLALDHWRTRYGRGEKPPGQRSRRQLVDLVGSALDLDQLPGRGEPADHRLEREEVGAALADALGALAPGDRLLLALRFEEDLTAARIAQVVGLPSQFHVYRRLQSLLRQLRDELRGRGVRGAAG